MADLRIALVELKQETNTFSPLPTRWEAFEMEGYVLRGEAIRERLAGTNTEIGGFLQGCQEVGYSAVPLFAAWALSGGALQADVHQALRTEFLAGFADQGPFDGVLVALHGALTADDCDDVEGTLLQSLRAAVGAQTPIVCTLDMHGNLTAAMVRNVSAIVPYHTYPHTDMGQCGRKAAGVLQRILGAKLSTACEMTKLPMVNPPENCATASGPMKEIFDLVDACERDPDVLAAGVFPVQPWLDVEEFGNAAVVTTVGGQREKARRMSQQLAELMWTRRHQLLADLLTIDEALAEARSTDGLCVLANSADSTGSGSPGDATDILSRLLAAEWDRPAYVPLVDPQAVEAAWSQGVGAAFAAHVGGKMDSTFNEPVLLRGRVARLAEPSFRLQGTAFSGVDVRLGRSAVVEAGAVSVLLTSNRPWTHDPNLYRCVGLAPEQANIVVVKSPLMYRAAYAGIAKKMLAVDSRGASPSRFTELPYRKVDRSFFPFSMSRAWAPQ